MTRSKKAGDGFPHAPILRRTDYVHGEVETAEDRLGMGWLDCRPIPGTGPLILQGGQARFACRG